MISLICTSFNKFKDVEILLSSLRCQSVSKDEFELVFVDQSEGAFSEIINSFPDLNIVYIKFHRCGLSKARNIGILKSKGNIFGFPDDDCKYYSHTLQSVLASFKDEQNLNTVIGRIYDINKKKNIFKNWPDRAKKISKFNFYSLCSSITIFTKNRSFFNEDLGAGSTFGSCEDVDFLYRKILYENISYSPKINVWHPEFTLLDMTKNKSLNYGLGFGRFHKINISFYLFIHFLLGNTYIFLRLLITLLKLDISSSKILYYSLKGRVLGFITR